MDSIDRATPGADILFICDPDDAEEIAAVQEGIEARANGSIEMARVAGNYAAKVNAGVRMTGNPLIFLGADDLHFHSGWFEEAKAKVSEGIEVVGVNDLCSDRVQRGEHATHFLITRGYAERPLIDGRPGPLCEQYLHNCVDDELFATARHRGVLAVASDAVVEHCHPDRDPERWPWDETYVKGREAIRRDRRQLHRRSRLWQ